MKHHEPRAFKTQASADRAVGRTDLLGLELIQQLKALFGTSTNAHRRLGLGEIVSARQLTVLMAGHPATPLAARWVRAAWDAYCETFLRVEAPPPAKFGSQLREYDPAARDSETGKLLYTLDRFTLHPRSYE